MAECNRFLFELLNIKLRFFSCKKNYITLYEHKSATQDSITSITKCILIIIIFRAKLSKKLNSCFLNVLENHNDKLCKTRNCITSKSPRN